MSLHIGSTTLSGFTGSYFIFSLVPGAICPHQPLHFWTRDYVRSECLLTLSTKLMLGQAPTTSCFIEEHLTFSKTFVLTLAWVTLCLSTHTRRKYQTLDNNWDNPEEVRSIWGQIWGACRPSNSNGTLRIDNDSATRWILNTLMGWQNKPPHCLLGIRVIFL